MMIRNLKLACIALISFFIFTSCIKIEEFVHFNKDMSGTFKMTVDMGEMSSLMNSLGGMFGGEENTDSENEDNSILGGLSGITGKDMNMNGAKVDLDSLLQIIGKLNGITHIKSKIGSNGMNVNYEFAFADIPSLNKALSLMQKSDLIDKKPTDAFKLKGNKLYRLKNDQMDELLNGKGLNDILGDGDKKKKKKTEEDDIFGDFDMSKMMGALGGEMTYTTIYEFDQEIGKSCNKNAELSDDKQTVKLIYYPLNEEKNNKKGMTNVIKLK